MKIRILSDLHLEFLQDYGGFTPPKVEADVVVLAGDIHVGTSALAWIREHFADVPVIYICGNHEGYHHDLWALKDALAQIEDTSNIRFLDNEWTEIKGTWFFGGTLWTDYALLGNVESAMQTAGWCMNDHRLIRYRGSKFTPDIALQLHKDAVKQIDEGLKRFPGKKVVVTHHLPSPKSIDPAYTMSSLNPAYASNLEHLMQGDNAPALWIHGHTHRSRDYVVENTRVVCNPKGYPSGEGKNPNFDPTLVVEV